MVISRIVSAGSRPVHIWLESCLICKVCLTLYIYIFFFTNTCIICAAEDEVEKPAANKFSPNKRSSQRFVLKGKRRAEVAAKATQPEGKRQKKVSVKGKSEERIQVCSIIVFHVLQF